MAEVSIVHEKDGFSLYVDDKFYGCYDTPVQAAQAYEEMEMKEENQNGSF